MCRPCQNAIHAFFTEKQLEREYYTIDLLKKNEQVIHWIEWVKKRPTWGL
jgi:hypothetical protein